MMTIPFEFILFAALLGTGLSVYLAFLPVTTTPPRVFKRGTAILAIAWMIISFVFSFKQPIFLLITGAGTISWWKFGQNDTTKGKLFLAFASGASIGWGVILLLQTYLALHQVTQTSTQFIWLASGAYGCSLLLGTSVTAVLCILEKDAHQTLKPSLSRTLIAHLTLSCLGLILMVFFKTLTPILFFMINVLGASAGIFLLKSQQTQPMLAVIYGLPIVAALAAFFSLKVLS